MKHLIWFLMLPASIISCKKSSSENNNLAPTNLVINANVVNDSSGNVAFTATASNAVSYFFDFGNSVSQEVTFGVITYKYPASGTYTVNVIAKSASGQTITGTAQVTVKVVMKLIFADEFDKPGAPDSTKWGYDLGAGGWGNAELQNYTNRTDNAIVSNGTLKIIAKAENYNGSPYTSARLLTKDKFSFKYGKIEARIKLPAGVGTWAAFWMLGNNISSVSWPASGEIDIMEHLGRELNKIYATVHHPGHSGANGDGSTMTIANASTEFHKYAAEWTESSIKFTVDNMLFYTFSNAPGLPFNQNFFVILNVAMGGNFGGPVDPAFSSAEMEVDYVRVYQ